MSHFLQEGQAVLFSVNVTRFAGILAAEGDLATSESREFGNLEDCGFDREELPAVPGLYVWEGCISGETGGYCGSEPLEPDIDWQGTIRPARLADLRRFGMLGVEFLFPADAAS
jgi:hypothetical protein